jgi:hypothetical protein
MPAAEEGAESSSDEASIMALQSGLNTGGGLCKRNIQAGGKGLCLKVIRRWLAIIGKLNLLSGVPRSRQTKGSLLRWNITIFVARESEPLARTEPILVVCASLTSKPFPR